MSQFIKIMLTKINRIVLFLVLNLGFQSQIYGQVSFDYINDWSNLFLSNINLVSSNQTYQKFSGPAEQRLMFNSQMTFNDFYREHRGSLQRNISFFKQLTTLQTEIGIKNQNVLLGIQYGLSQKNLNYDMTDTQSLNLQNSYKVYRIFASTTVFQDYVIISGGLGRKIINNFEFNPWNFGATFQPSKSISFTYHRYEDFFRWEYNFNIDGSSEQLVADEFSQLDEYRIWLNLIPELTITATMQNNYINKDRFADVSNTILVPTGTHYQRSIEISVFPEKQLAFNLHYYSRNNDLIGYFYNSHQIFGKLTEQKDHSEYYKSEVVYQLKSHNYGLNLGWAKGMLSTNGHVESWPFTPTMVDLLGLRYNFRSDLTYDLFRIGASYQYRGSDWQLLFRSSFERIKPGGGVRTWEPEMLVFGVKNLNIYNLASKTWDGIYLGLNLRKSFGTLFQLAYEFQQYVPVKFRQSKQSDNSSEDSELIQKSVYGGGKHKFYLVINL